MVGPGGKILNIFSISAILASFYLKGLFFVGKIEVSSAQYSKLQEKSQDLGFSLIFSHF